MNTNKLLTMLSEMPVEDLAQAHITFNEMVEMDKEINIDTLLMALPANLKMIVNEVAELRLQVLKLLIDAGRKKNKNKNQSVNEVIQNIGMIDIENEIIKLLPEDIHFLSYQITAKLEVLYLLFEKITNLDHIMQQGIDDAIISKIMTPIERLKRSILKKRDHEKKIDENIGVIEEKANMEIAQLKTVDGYDSLKIEVESFNEAIGFLTGSIHISRQKNDNDKNDLAMMEDAKSALILQLNVKINKMLEIDNKFKPQIDVINKERKEKIRLLAKTEVDAEENESNALNARLKMAIEKLKKNEEKTYLPMIQKIQEECSDYYQHLQDTLFDQLINLEVNGASKVKMNAMKELSSILESENSPFVKYEKFITCYKNNKNNFSVVVDARTKEFFSVIDDIIFPPSRLQLAVYGLFGFSKAPTPAVEQLKQENTVVQMP